MKKIVFLTEDITGAGGVVRVISLWSNYFIKNYKIEIISSKKGTSYFSLDKKIKLTFENLLFNKSLFAILKNLFIMNKLLKKEKDNEVFYIINKAAYIMPIYLLKKIKTIKRVKFIYFSHGGNSDFEYFYMKRKYGKLLTKIIFKTFDKVVCLYKDIEEMPKIVIQEKISYIPNTLSFSILKEKSIKKEKIILYVGRITKEKGIDYLIKAWSRIYRDTDYVLVLVGEGKDKKEFQKLSEELEISKDRIVFKPGTNEVLDFYKKAEIFVLPSLFDGMPMALIEAKSQRVAVIATETSGGKKLIKNYETGLLCKIQNEKELAEKLKLLITDEILRENIIENSIKQIEEYQIEKNFKKWEPILGEIL